MKKIFSILLMSTLILTLITGCSTTKKDSQPNNQTKTAGKDTTIVMYTNAEFPPYEYYEGENIKGVDVDVATEIAKDLGKELKVENTNFDSIIPAVQEGKADFGAAGLSITPERQEEVDFSIPYSVSIQNIISKNDAPVKSMAELKGKKIGVQLGTTGDLTISDAISKEDGLLYNSNAEVKQYKSALEAAQDLAAGRIDAVVVDKLPANEIVKNNDKLQTVVCDQLSEESYAICVKKGNKELLDSINKTLQRLIDEGKIDEYIVNHSK